MIHDKARVDAIRAQMTAQLELIKSLEAKITKGKLEQLEVARNQTEDIETLYLNDLERTARTKAQEAEWLYSAEQMLQIWGPYLQETKERFSKGGDIGIEIIGG